jgi:serine/threonine protein kinase
MAPEFIEGGAPTTQTDVYALGVLSYLMIAGELPFRAPDLAKLLALHIGAAPVSLLKFRPELSPEVDKLVLQCLAKAPGSRPASAGVLEEAWKTLLGGAPNPAIVRSAIAELLLQPPLPPLPPPAPSQSEHTLQLASEQPGTEAPAQNNFADLVLRALTPQEQAETDVLPRVPPASAPPPPAIWIPDPEKDSVTQIVALIPLPPLVEAPEAQPPAPRQKEEETEEITDPRLMSSLEFQVQRRRLWVLVAIVAALLVVAGGVLAVVLVRQSPRSRAILDAFVRAVRGLFQG